MIPIIGLSGKMGSGKTTAGEYLKKYGYQRYSFATRLKVMVASLDNSDPTDPEWKSGTIDGWDATRGALLQKLGSSLREMNPDTWVLALFATLPAYHPYIVIDDVRYPNEANAIRARGGIIVRLENPNNSSSNQSGRDMNHHSETALDNYEFDHIISAENLDELYEALDNIVQTNC